jgi:hypothetical protein
MVKKHAVVCQAAAEEFQATREAVTLCDYSSFAKMELWSAGREVDKLLIKIFIIINFRCCVLL